MATKEQSAAWYLRNRDRILREKKQYYTKNREHHLQRKKASYQLRRQQVADQLLSDKEAAINVYTNGEGTCRRCGQGDIDVLCLDHIANDGASHRRAVGKNAYAWAQRNDYPPIFQVLCYNCNMKKEMERRRTLWLS